MQPRSHRIALGTGLTYHLLEWGHERAGDHTVLLLHGFLDLCWGWEETVAAGLSERYHVLAPDLRGHGDSDWIGPGGYYHFMDYLADVHEVIEQLGRPQLSLVGHSMGGTIASYYAGAYPARVSKLALLEGLGPPEDPQPVPERVDRWLRSWRRARSKPAPGYADLAEAAARLRSHDPLLLPALAEQLARHGTRRDPDGRLRFKHDPLHLSVGPLPFRVALAEGFWRRIRCPVLLVEGEASLLRYPPEEQARRRAAFADARPVILPAAGHMMQRHQPAKLAQLLVDFLDAPCTS